ncbi:MAG: LysR family transcriptional regulator [Myxococcota bacterium]
MKYTREVAQYWSWLPAFRAVAETQHLPTAAKALCLSPSAVSRTIKLLEEQLGYPLFDRTQGRLKLNERGAVLLRSVRTAMRVVHEGTMAMEDDQLRASLQVYAPSDLADIFVLPALAKLHDAHPELNAGIQSGLADSLTVLLERGGLDLVISEDLPPTDAHHVEPLVTLTHDVFVRPGNHTPIEDLRFVVTLAAKPRRFADAWPFGRPRHVGLRVGSRSMAVDAVMQGFDAVVLPICLGRQTQLQRRHVPGLRSSTLVMMQRTPLPEFATATEIVSRSVANFARSVNLEGVNPCGPVANEAHQSASP